MQKNISFKVKGMQRDLSVSAFSSEFAYENKNVRIMPTNESTLLSLTNERGNKKSDIVGVGDHIMGTPIGQTVIDNELILFTVGDKSALDASIDAETLTINDITIDIEEADIDYPFEDRIYKFWFNNKLLSGKLLFRGDLGFNYKYPIEAIATYENLDIKKVYWTDNLNQPRVINIAAADNVKDMWTEDSFNFVRRLSLREKITIEKSKSPGGIFAPGTIQYAFTYCTRYGQESNIFYTSPLYYISYNDRGGSPEDSINNSFNITIKNPDTTFDFIRVYSIQRTSINATAVTKIVAELSIPTDGSTMYLTDTGTIGSITDPANLLYIGGEEVTVGTMEQKDNTLFLGDITLQRAIIPSELQKELKSSGKYLTFTTTNGRTLPKYEPGGYYSYKNQLGKNSNQIKTFKYLDWYRFGVQFQHVTGKWSEPIFICDKQNTCHIDSVFYNSETVLPQAELSLQLNSSENFQKLVELGYVKVRPVIVYPTINDREVICQGVLCPTVYNVNDRYTNSPFAQSSWFARPNAPFDIEKSKTDQSPFSDAQNENTLYSRWGVTTLESSKPSRIGTWSEFRHNMPIPSNEQRNAEIQCIYKPPTQITTASSSAKNWVDNYSENFYVDQSIVTLHSPDIEFDTDVQNLDLTNLKLRIVGMVPMTAFYSDIDIATSTVGNTLNYTDESTNAVTAPSTGFNKQNIGVESNFTEGTPQVSMQYKDSYFGWRGLNAGMFWLDEMTDRVNSNPQLIETGFIVYPWHRNGSLNNTATAKDGYKSALLKTKKMSNLRYSFNTQYLDYNSIWNAYVKGNNNYTGISGAQIFNSNEVSLIKIPAPKNSNLNDIIYYGNVDKVVTLSRVKISDTEDKSKGYPIIVVKGVVGQGASYYFNNTYQELTENDAKQYKGLDPVHIKYKSTPHIVMALNYSIDSTSGNLQKILPTIEDSDNSYTNPRKWTINDSNIRYSNYPFWVKDTTQGTKKYGGVVQDVLDIDFSVQEQVNSNEFISLNGTQSPAHGWLWLGELYNDNVQNRFGGDTPEAIENNNWVPAGESVDLLDSVSSLKQEINIVWTEGDTYYQRYDHIKTYPFTLEDQNSVTDVVSFMCETRVNIDGRYDRNRGLLSNLVVTPANFNKLNDAYSQPNNFFNYRSLNPNRVNLDNFRNVVTWTKTKTLGEYTDTWTNITLASTLDLDGDKGPVRAIRRLNNNLIVFQDKGISNILYNENMQLATTEGVPIEIANSGKVNGKRYLSNNIGCTNKWSICVTPGGIYFIDSLTKGIFVFNDELKNLSDSLGFHSWINEKSKDVSIWNPVDFEGFTTYYDKVNSDVFFISKEECLGYSEPLGQFTSFYSYENTPYFTNLEDRGISFNVGGNDTLYRPWLHNEGDYNMFFGVYQPFYTTVIANPDMQADKVFNNLEFRADSWDKNGNLLNTTFDTLTTWNEYQEGVVDLTNIPNRPSTLKKKFRIWRANIPRAKANGRDRMRNPWLYVKLSMEKENTNKTILHDMMVHYFE